MMLFIPPYARTNNRAMITEAFAPKTLMGLQGCGCAGASGADGVMRNLAGLGVADCSDSGNWGYVQDGSDCYYVCADDSSNRYKVDPGDCGIGSPVDTSKPSAPRSAVCDDTGLWRSAKDIQGKCMSYCTADPTQYFEVEAAACTGGGGSGKISGSTIAIAAVAAGVLMMMVTQ